MKKLVLFVMMVISPLSWAEWVSAGSTIDGAGEVYFDSTSVQKNGSVIKVFWIKNYPSQQATRKGKKYQSVKIFGIYDCKSETSKRPSIVFYSGSMGAGEAVISAVFQEEDEKFTPLLPDTEDAMISKIVCNDLNIGNQRDALPNAGGGKKLIKLFVAGPNEGNEAGASVYIDSKSLTGSFPNKKFTLVIDYPAPMAVEKFMMNSAVMKMEMNCSESSIRLVKIELMSDKLGSGDLLKNVEGDTWRKIPANFHMLPDLVCVK